MIQGIHRHFKEECILLDLDAYLDIPEEIEDCSEKQKRAFKKEILNILVKLFERTGKIVNPSKCLTDLYHRELKATTAFGMAVAMPHVRTLQAKGFMIAIMKSDQGLYFDSLDGELVHYFIGIVCPPYEDKLYLRFLSEISKLIQCGKFKEMMETSFSESELLGKFCRYRAVP